ncbi:DNA-binding response regulator, NarL/FixJ family, contains REC and HTH domains [Filimonas lacunae]|uniref:DNA-binding response regulator, NarL/FixJ family, contains REC and HTH domains n=1 Tax=Filimonas lacunae TaxID=477680 RepID=A0A173MJU3_9BACT|nr:response regulator transcription factor [Filimonas lacunae]BAV07681.1 regulatory protein, LuxR:response regulator receiver [Filimonas lacunae]SIT03450.1 DNA-binding response regulator, NarL/FixJ family, contains REC and HTH domains [Filimonas lacunae]
MKATIGIADEQQLFITSVSLLINTFEHFVVTFNALNGTELLSMLHRTSETPDVLLISPRLPGINVQEAVACIAEEFPLIKTVALLEAYNEDIISDMLQAGCSTYVLKSMNPVELENALRQIEEKGYYNADGIDHDYRQLLRMKNRRKQPVMNERELQFLQLASSDLTYNEIAKKMSLPEKVIDAYRDSLFQKFRVRSRVGLTMEAIRNNLITT